MNSAPPKEKEEEEAQERHGPHKRHGLRLSLAARFALMAAALVLLGIAASLLAIHFLPNQYGLAALLAMLVMTPVIMLLVRSQLQPMLALFQALCGTVISYRDGDYSFSLHWPRRDELGELVDAHNALGDVLREQRRDLIERELLLDTMLQNTPVAMLLIVQSGPIVFANIAARQLLNQGKKLEGHRLADLLQQVSPALREALNVVKGEAKGGATSGATSDSGDSLFSVNAQHPGDPGDPGDADPQEEIYHLSRRNFSLNGRNHTLLQIRHLTVELRRQEVVTWKKVIRVISHELNNSLAPVASLAHSGAQLVRRGQTERLPQILETIEERARHLKSFIHGYARFAKMPTPRMASTGWPKFVAALQAQVSFTQRGELPQDPVSFDIAQIEQALLNLIKNAHESGSPAADVCLSVRRMHDAHRIEVMDRGSGMNPAVMSNALVPFYSTKRNGTGLGLALAREIIEAHGGRIMLANRDGGGVMVTMILPCG
jgi:two-component system nitrogen regulation sensor histidine kinase NtrY